MSDVSSNQYEKLFRKNKNMSESKEAIGLSALCIEMLICWVNFNGKENPRLLIPSDVDEDNNDSNLFYAITVRHHSNCLYGLSNLILVTKIKLLSLFSYILNLIFAVLQFSRSKTIWEYFLKGKISLFQLFKHKGFLNTNIICQMHLWKKC